MSGQRSDSRSGARVGAARLLLGLPVVAAGALVGLCLTPAPSRPPLERATTARPASTREPLRLDAATGSSPRDHDQGLAEVLALASSAASSAASSVAFASTSEASGADACCGAGHDDDAPHDAALRALLTGRVLDPAGFALASARVEARGADGALAAVGQSDADGRFRLAAAPGPLGVVARCAGWADGRALPVTLRAGDAVDVGDVRLTEGAALTGRVVDDAGRTVGGARVEVAAEGRGERHVVSEADGSFEVTGLEPGEMTLVARAAGALPSEPARATAGERGLELRLRARPELRGQVVGPDGRPVAGASVARLGDLDAAARTDAEGRFVLRGEREGEPLLVTAPGLSAARVDASADLEVRLVAVAPGPGTTARLALRRGDAPAPGVTLLVAPAGAADQDGDDAARVEVVTSDAAGVVWLAPGAFDLALVEAATAHARLETRSLAASEALATWSLEVPAR